MAVNLNSILIRLIGMVFFTAPMAFLTMRPVVNVFIVDVFILAVITVFFVGALRGVYGVSKNFLLAISLVLFGYILSGVNAIDNAAHFIGFAQYAFVLIFLLVLRSVISDENDVKKLLIFYISGAAISVIISYAIYFQLISMPHLKEYTAGRFNGVWGNPNTMSRIMIDLIMLLLALIVYSSKALWVIFLYSLLALFAFYLILSSASFGGVLFLLMSISVFTLIYYYQSPILDIQRIAAYLFGLFLIFLGFLLSVDIFQYLPTIFVDRVLSAEGFSQAGSGEGKLAQIILGFKIFLENPVFGAGLENGRYVNEAALIHHESYVSFHSFYSAVMVEGGFFSVIGFLLLFIILFKNSLGAKKFKFVFLIIFSTFLINLIISNNIYTRFFWFPAAILSISLTARGRKLPQIADR